MKTIEERLAAWALGNDTGLSSRAIAAHMIGVESNDMRYPSDPSDLGRCLRLLSEIPEWKPRISEMAKYSPGWSGLVSEWDKIEQSMIEDVGIDWSKGNRAKETYKLMKLAIAKGYRTDERYQCTFLPDGTLSSARRIIK